MANELTPPKKTRAPAKPRTVYVLYKPLDNGDIDLIGVFSKGGAVISIMDQNKDVRFRKAVINNSNE